MVVNTPQPQFYDTTNIVVPDISQLYNNYITEIDSYRSRFNAIDSTLSQSISANKIDQIFSNTNIITPGYQESRLHAFFRTIGFPVVAQNNQFYNPGFNPAVNQNNDTFNSQIQIANNPFPDLFALVNQREKYFKNIINIFSNQDQNSIAYAIASTYPRAFDRQFQDKIPALSPDPQVQLVPDRISVLQFFSDLSLNISPGAISLSTHIIKPFIVDARIELTVIPAKNRICAPFALDRSQTQIVSGASAVQLKRPYIEKVISTVFNVQNVSMNLNSTYIDNILNFIKEDNNVVDQSLLTALATDLNSLNTNSITTFSNYIQIARSIVYTLVDSIVYINRIRTSINWQPIPNVKGPEFGSSLNPVSLTDSRNKEIEKNINILTARKTVSDLNFNIGLSGPDTSGFAFSGIDDIIFGSFKNANTFYDDQINNLTSIRNNYGNKANSALENIEIIMGEYSGIGLLDILAVQAAFWLMPQQYLIGFLDPNAFNRMQTNNQLTYKITNSVSILDTLNNYEQNIKQIYKLFQSFYDSRLGKIQLNAQT